MKKYLIIHVLILTLIDQLIKTLIFNSFDLRFHFHIIEGFLAFQPSKNIHLGWIPSMLDYMMPLHVSILYNVIGFPLVVIMYKFMRFTDGLLIFDKYKKLPVMYLTLAISGTLCKMTDDIFWGGSIDYILLFNWFVFDLKDVYISSCMVLIVIYSVIYFKYYYNLSKSERKEHDKEIKSLKWLKPGLPSQA